MPQDGWEYLTHQGLSFYRYRIDGKTVAAIIRTRGPRQGPAEIVVQQKRGGEVKAVLHNETLTNAKQTARDMMTAEGWCHA
jgi:hypothetical protein